jgi:hypothetical protein
MPKQLSSFYTFLRVPGQSFKSESTNYLPCNLSASSQRPPKHEVSLKILSHYSDYEEINPCKYTTAAALHLCFSCLTSSPSRRVKHGSPKCLPATQYLSSMLHLTCVLIRCSSQSSTSRSSIATRSGSYSTGGGGGGGGGGASGGSGSNGTPNQPREYANASSRSDPWTPYSVDRKRTGKLVADLDDILTKFHRGGGGDASGGVGN